MRYLATLLAIFLSLFTASVSASDADAEAQTQALARGRALSDLFLQARSEQLWSQMTPKMQEALGNQAALATFREQVGAQLGDELEVLDEKVTLADGHGTYLRTSRWSKLPQRILMQWVIDGDNHVAGFFVRPDQIAVTPAESKYLAYQTRADLRLPFDGEWFVFWGGRTAEQNYHVMNRGQRFAYDMLILRDGKSHRGNGAKLEDFYCWNQPIRSPAAGTIAHIVDGLADQTPGSMDAANAAGNHVIVDLGNDEYALLAHLRQGSVRVKRGDKVVAGDELGRCGNSGNTSEPHLHFHLQNTARFGDGDGLPAFFNHYIADGKPVARAEPLKGQRIRRN
jgi:hypothetical protein